jgi:Poly(hydroxyalcanoate) granule associated protein (phasin)
MLNNLNTRATAVGDNLMRASRQFWLAGLGAAVVTRDWAEKEGGVVFRNLVREGTAIESRAIRFVGDRLESSFAQANTMWKRTRRTVTTTVKTYADTATTLVRETLPVSLPKVAMPVAVKVRAKPAAKRKVARAKRAATSPAKTAAKRTKRAVRSAKRG